MAEDLRIQFLRGNTGQNAIYTGAEGEITADISNDKCLHLHDGVTKGGFVLLSTENLARNTSTRRYHIDPDAPLGGSGSPDHPFQSYQDFMGNLPSSARNAKSVQLFFIRDKTHYIESTEGQALTVPRIEFSTWYHYYDSVYTPDDGSARRTEEMASRAILQMMPRKRAADGSTAKNVDCVLYGNGSASQAHTAVFNEIKVHTGLIPQAWVDDGWIPYGGGNYGGLLSRGHKWNVHFRDVEVDVGDFPVLTASGVVDISIYASFKINRIANRNFEAMFSEGQPPSSYMGNRPSVEGFTEHDYTVLNCESILTTNSNFLKADASSTPRKFSKAVENFIQSGELNGRYWTRYPSGVQETWMCFDINPADPNSSPWGFTWNNTTKTLTIDSVAVPVGFVTGRLNNHVSTSCHSAGATMLHDDVRGTDGAFGGCTLTFDGTPTRVEYRIKVTGRWFDPL